MTAAQSFIGRTTLGPTAANLSHLQFKNPAASGVVLALQRLVIARSTAGQVIVNRHDTDLTTLNANVIANKWLGTAAGSAQMRSQNNATELGFPQMARLDVLAATPFDLVFADAPLILEAGVGIVIVPDAVNVRCSIFAEWRETPE